jgi:glutamine amidotransferase
MTTIVNYGLGNIGSILSMLRKLGKPGVATDDPQKIAVAEKLILPGVGSFDAAVTNLKGKGLWNVLDRRVREDHVPILGICLGMQLFSFGSEEGNLPGFGWIQARFVRFTPSVGSSLRVPHMGWNSVRIVNPSGILPIAKEPRRFYFVHSYKAVCDRQEDVLGVTDYGGEFVSAYGRKNVTGVQFHPEKSHRFGLDLFENFLRL